MKNMEVVADDVLEISHYTLLRETPGHYWDEQRGTTLPEHLTFGGISLSCDAVLSLSTLYLQSTALIPSSSMETKGWVVTLEKSARGVALMGCFTLVSATSTRQE